MKINISQIMECIVPWDFSIIMDGNEYPTVRPSIGLIGRLQAMTSNSMPPTIKDIFVAPGPDMSGWPADSLIAIGAAYMAHFGNQSSKNSLPVAEKIRAAMGLSQPSK